MNDEQEFKAYVTGLAVAFIVLCALVYVNTLDATPILV